MDCGILASLTQDKICEIQNRNAGHKDALRLFLLLCLPSKNNKQSNSDNHIIT